MVVRCRQAGVHPVSWKSYSRAPSSARPDVTSSSKFVRHLEASWSPCLLELSPNSSRDLFYKAEVSILPGAASPSRRADLCSRDSSECLEDLRGPYGEALLRPVPEGSSMTTWSPYSLRRCHQRCRTVGVTRDVCFGAVCKLRTSYASMCMVQVPQHAPYDHLRSVCVRPDSCVSSVRCQIHPSCSARIIGN